MLSFRAAVASIYSYHMAQQDVLDKTLTNVPMIILYVGHISPHIGTLYTALSTNASQTVE